MLAATDINLASVPPEAQVQTQAQAQAQARKWGIFRSSREGKGKVLIDLLRILQSIPVSAIGELWVFPHGSM